MLSQRQNELWDTSGRLRIVVIGGGISGLAAAYRIVSETSSRENAPEVLLFEGSPRLGGCISTYNLDDTILELGPDAFITDKPAGLELCRKLGITHRLVQTEKSHRRTFIAHDNKLHPLPEGFMLMAPTQILPFMASSLFSWEGKLRLLQEPFIPPADPDLDESLQQFTERRLGKEVFQRVVQPLVGGIYTADPAKLSIRAALPRMTNLEQKYGSVIKGLTATRKKSEGESGARYGMFVTFDDGMNVLVNSIAAQLPEGSVHTHCLVSRIRRSPDNGWIVQLSEGTQVKADAVVLATSSFHASDIVCELDSGLSHELNGIEYASSAVLNLVYRRVDIPHPLDGFGFVVPFSEKRHILACSFASVKWPNRAPNDRVLLRVFIGGALQNDVYELTDEQIECLIWEDLHAYLGIRSVPIMSIISRFPRAMPQYNVGHLARIQRINQSVASHPGLAIAGNAYTGVGVPDCIASGEQAADAALKHIMQRASVQQ